jgi:hypothetical protein
LNLLAEPDRIVDRGIEWRHLASFASRKAPGPRLGVVGGADQARPTSWRL